MQLIELQPIKPFVGTYRCSVAEADVIDEQLVDKENGLVVKEKIPRKRFIGLIPVVRAIRKEEVEALQKGQSLENVEVSEDGMTVTEHPSVRTVSVPPAVASSLISRGLAIRVEPAKEAGKKGGAAA